MNLQDYFNDELEDHGEVLAKTRAALGPSFQEMLKCWITAIEGGHKILFFGNGGNDLGFDEVFARQVDALGQPGDVAVGISTSGTSPNIVKALEMARKNGLVTNAFTGRDGGKMPSLADVSLIVPAQSTRRIQEMHITLGHMLCGALEKSLKLV